MPQTFTPDEIARLVSVGTIAKENGHSRMATYKAIARLKIKPVMTAPYRLYSPEITATLKAAMRPAPTEAC